jgi:hypothetical protein
MFTLTWINESGSKGSRVFESEELALAYYFKITEKCNVTEVVLITESENI